MGRNTAPVIGVPLICFMLIVSIQSCQLTNRLAATEPTPTVYELHPTYLSVVVEPTPTSFDLRRTQLPMGVEPTTTLPDPHHHVVDVDGLMPDVVATFQMTETVVGPEAERYDVTQNQSGTWEAYLVHQQLSGNEFREKLIVQNLQAGKMYEIQGLPLPKRLVSDLVWVTDNVLVFDKWSNPYYGIHYAVDVQEGKLILASAFPDHLP